MTERFTTFQNNEEDPPNEVQAVRTFRALLRHPIYLGNMLLMAGILIATFNPFVAALAALLLVSYLFAVRDENRDHARREAAVGDDVDA